MLVEGPIISQEAPVGGLIPDSDAARLLKEYDYLEEEYFISGTANVYGPGSFDPVEPNQQFSLVRKPLSTVRQADVPFKTRVLLVRPRDPKSFCGYVHVGPNHVLHPWGPLNLDHMRTGMIDISVEVNDGARYGTEAQWSGGVAHLKRVDPGRYQGLSITGGNTEEWGLPDELVCKAWANMNIHGHSWQHELLSMEMFRCLAHGPDIVLQVAKGLKLGSNGSLLPGFDVRRIFTSGASGSSLIPNSLVNDGHHNRNMLPDGRPPFDGYFIFVGLAVGTTGRPDNAVLVGFLSENEVLQKTGHNFPSYYSGLIDPPANTDEPKFRYYEMPATGHVYSPEIPTASRGGMDMTRRGIGGEHPVIPPTGTFSERVTSGEWEYSNKVTSPIVTALWDGMYRWLEEGVPMPEADPIGRDDSPEGIARDEHGNALGGIRTPWVEVPEATYRAQISPRDQNFAGMKRFSAEKMRELYGNSEEYEKRIDAKLDELVEQRLLRSEEKQVMAPPPTINF